MAQLPELRSRSSIINDLITGFLARVEGVDDLNDNSVMRQFFESVGQHTFKTYADIIALISAFSVDRAVGDTLQRLARDGNVPIFPARASAGKIDITDTSFSKISSVVYTGQPAPVAGSLTLYVADASKFSSVGGTIYIGRGTNNSEGPLEYITTQSEAGGAYWSITLAATSATTKFHNIGESVVMGQGGERTVSVGTTARTVAGNALQSVTFSTSATAKILDGEIQVRNVPVVCDTTGPLGNVPKGAVREVLGLAFQATCTNRQPFRGGLDADQDDDIKKRIKEYEQSKSKGTEVALRSAADGVVATDEQKSVHSASISRYGDSSAAVVFDDGQGYEPWFVGAGYEMVVDEAFGGEKELQLRDYQVAQARIKNNVDAPFDSLDGKSLSVQVGDETSTHLFLLADFKVPESPTSFEVVTSINNDPNLNFLASTADDATRVVLYPRNRNNNDIRVVPPEVGENANTVLQFPNLVEYSLRLYKDDKPLYQDGLIARFSTRDKATWSTAIIEGDTLIYRVDDTVELTVTFYTSDFQAVDPTAIMSSLTSTDIWVSVFNNKMPGVSASIVGEKVTFQSNLGAENRAKIEFLGGTLLNKIFPIGVDAIASGQSFDYTLNKQTGQLSLVASMQRGQKLTAGSNFIRAKATTTSLPSGPAQDGSVWMVVDGDTEIIPNNILADTFIEFQKAGTKLSIIGKDAIGDPQGFDLVEQGDWILVWANSFDPAELISNSGFWRVESVSVGEIVVDDGTITRSDLNSPTLANSDRIVIVRSDAPMQHLRFTIGSLADFTQQIEAQIKGVNADIIGSSVRFSTITESEQGELLFVAVDQGGKNLDLPTGTPILNVDSHYGYVITSDTEANIPHFTMSEFGTSINDDEFEVPDYLDLYGIEYDFVELLNKYNAVDLTDVIDSNYGRRSFVKQFDRATGVLAMTSPNYMKQGSTPIQEGDRFYLRSPYQFDSSDTLTIVVDSNPTTNTFTLPVARKLTISDHSAPTTQDFSADDAESVLDMKDAASFGNFQFNDFLAFRQSAAVLTNGIGANDYSIRFKASDFGPLGDRYRVGFVYPQSSTEEELNIRTHVSDLIDIGIVLPVIESRTPDWDHTSSFTADVITTNGRDEIKFTYRSGREPDFSVISANVSVGDVCMISASAHFLAENRDLYAKVIDATPTTFTLELPTGKVVSDNIVFDDIINLNGTITVTTPVPHSIPDKQRVGFWDTASTDGIAKPLDDSYIATLVSPTVFTVPAPLTTPGGIISSATHLSNIVTITSTSHGLSVGNIILISGVSAGSYNGLVAVSEVVNTNQFKCVKAGISPSIANTGRFDFQSYGDNVSSTLSTVSLSAGIVTAVTPAIHAFSSGDIVAIENVDIDDWLVGSTYAKQDVIEYDSILYISLTNANVGNQPDTSPSDWTITDQDLTGVFVVDSAPDNLTFTYYYFNTQGSASGTGGSATSSSPVGKLARSLGGSSADNLQFGQVETTAQDVIDFVIDEYDGKLSVDIYNGQSPAAIIDTSTADLQASTDYLTGNVTNLRVIKSNFDIEIDVDIVVEEGARITIVGLTGGLDKYNGTYVILKATEISAGPLNYRLVVHTPYFSYETVSSVVVATFQGMTPFLKMTDGLNSVASNDLASLGGTPMFTMKKAWKNVPQIGDELRLVAVNTDQLTRFWNKLIVTGLSNSARITNAEYGRQIQIVSNTFGSRGSIEVAGGSANRLEIALEGSSSEYNGKVGLFTVPFDVRKGLGVGYWIQISNTVRQNRDVEFNGLTSLKLWDDGLEITGGTPGSFQTERSTTQDETTKLRMEKHGEFMAFIGIGGTSIGLDVGEVQEGDWVRLKNVVETLWNSGDSYDADDRVLYDGLNWTALVASGPSYGGAIEPGTDSSVWENQEFTSSNQGIYQIVRTFGSDVFWVEAGNLVEQMITLGNAANMKFYSYDSVMPGDTLVIASEVLGAASVGRYTVVDESYGLGFSFPTEKRIWTELIIAQENPWSGSIDYIAGARVYYGGFNWMALANSGPSWGGAVTPGINPAVWEIQTTSSATLGGNFNQINVEEGDPLHLYKRIQAVGFTSGDTATVLTSSPILMNKFSSSLGAYVALQSKLNYNEEVNFGVDSYKYYKGLIKELNKVIYGDPVNPISYPGIRAAGTDVDIKPAIIKRIKLSASVRVRTGTPFSIIRDEVKASIAGYINTLGVGGTVSLSKVIEAASGVDGILSIVITDPTYDASNDIIHVNADEKALVVDPSTDIIISVLSDEVGES